MEKPITFKNKNKQIVGILHIPENDKKQSPGIILYHGFTGNKSESHFIFTKLAREISKKGIYVLRIDFRGSGDSEGRFEEMTLETEISDAEKSIEFLTEQKGVDRNRIGVLGLSMGTVPAVCISSKFKNVISLCLWSPLAYPDRIKKFLPVKMRKKIEKYGKTYLTGTGHYLGKDFLDTLDKIKPLKYAENYRGNVLIIHTEDDSTLFLNHSLAYFKTFHKNSNFCELIVFKKGGHTFTTEYSEKNAISETTKFFLKTLEQ